MVFIAALLQRPGAVPNAEPAVGGAAVGWIIAGTNFGGFPMIRKLPSGEYRLYSRKVNSKTGKRRNLGTFSSRSAAIKHEQAVQYFKRQ